LEEEAMATYAAVRSQTDDWGETTDRFKYRWQADQRLEEIRATGAFGRIVRWQKGIPTEMVRVNDVPPAGNG